MTTGDPKVSPSVKNVPSYFTKMTFPMAMNEVMTGRRVTKLEWDNPEIYVFLDSYLRIKLEDGIHDLIVSDGDMYGEDWVII